MIILDPDKYNIHPIEDNLYYKVISSYECVLFSSVKEVQEDTLKNLKPEDIYLSIIGYHQRGVSSPTLSNFLYLFKAEENKTLFKLKYGL